MGKKENEALVGRAVEGLQYLMGFQTASRAITFILNILIVRAISPEVFGAANTFTQLYLNMALFLGREACRRTCLREGEKEEEGKEREEEEGEGGLKKRKGVKKEKEMKEEEEKGMGGEREREKKRKQTANLVWFCMIVGTFITIFLGIILYFIAPEEEKEVEWYTICLFCFCFGICLELFSEPFYLNFQIHLLFRTRVFIEAFSLFVKCLVTFLFAKMGFSLLSFAIGQLAYSLSLLLSYFFFFLKNPPFPEGGSFSVKPLLSSTQFPVLLRFSWQSVQKVVLSQGENMVLRAYIDLEHRGGYGVVNNLGSLVVRFFFQPFEEVTYALFSRAHCNKEEGKENDALLGQILETSLKLMIIIGTIFCCFGPNYSFVLLEILFGSKYSQGETPSLLSFYCCYVLLLGVNGVTEAFAHSMATPSQLSLFNLSLLFFSLIFTLSSIFLVDLFGTSGIIFANSICMVLRIFVSSFFIAWYFGEREKGEKGEKREKGEREEKGETKKKRSISFWRICPSFFVIGFGIVSFFVTRFSMHKFEIGNVWVDWRNVLIHVSIGVVCFVLFLFSIYWREKNFISSCRSLIAKRKSS